MQFLDLGWVESTIRNLMAMLCQFIYGLISWFYNLFMNISKVNILGSDDIQPIYQRITMILTIIMIFYVTFEFVKFVVQPDGITDKEKGVGNIVYKMVIVVVLIAFVPTIFTWGYKLQTAIVDKGIIGKVIIGQSTTDPAKFGSTFSANLLAMFYRVDEENIEKTCGDIQCGTLVQMNLGMLAQNGTLDYLTLGLNASTEVETNVKGKKAEVALINFDFNGFLPVVVGAIVLYILALYCIDVGTRWAQMIFLQVIAPIPIIGYLSPKKDGIFQKWCKQCLTTYLDLFIRIAIIYFVLLICSILMDAYTTGELLKGIDSSMATFVYIALILGVMLFASKAPKLLEELFPKSGAASGNFGLKAGQRVAPMAARAIGAGLGATRAVGGMIARGYNKHARNKANNAKPRGTKEGNEQYNERQKHKQNSRNARKDLRTTSGVQKRVSDEQVNQAKQKVKNANEKYKAAKGTASEAQAKKELDAAAKDYRTLMRKRSGVTDEMLEKRHEFAQKRDNLNKAQKDLEAAKLTGDQAKIAEAQSKAKQAESEFKKATDNYTNTLGRSKEENSVAQNWKDIISSKAKAEETQQKLNTAEEELRKAEATGDDKQIKAAQAKVDALTQANADAQKDLQYQNERYKNVMSGDVEAQKAKYDDSLSQIAEDNNTKYSSVVGSGLWGAVAGGVTGAWHGAKATKLEDVWSKAKEGHRQDVKNIQELNKYYDNGGNVGIGGTVDRTVAKIQKSIGMDTAYARTNLETQSLTSKIKAYDETISRAENTKKSFDATEDRIKSKLGESKFVIDEDGENVQKIIKTGLFEKNEDGTLKMGADGKPIPLKYDKIQKGMRIADVVRTAKADASTAKASADQMAKQAQDYKNQNANILTQDRATLTVDQQAEYDRVKNESERLAAEAAKSSKNAADAEFMATQIEKNAARYVFTQMLQGKPGEYDAVAKEYLEDQKGSIRIAAQDAEIRERLRKWAEDPTNKLLDLKAFNSFMTGKFSDYDELDSVISAIANAKNEIARSKQGVQDQKTRNESSNVTQAQKAAQDYNGGSGK